LIDRQNQNPDTRKLQKMKRRDLLYLAGRGQPDGDRHMAQNKECMCGISAHDCSIARILWAKHPDGGATWWGEHPGGEIRRNGS
jgi:hypothetical protein